MPKRIDHEQRKKEILREALELFSAQGYEATTLADIAKAACIARPTLYQYFRNKHQLLFFASKQFTDEFLVYYQQIVDLDKVAPIHRLRFILSHIVLSCKEKRRELVSQSAFILKLEQEGRSIGELVHKRTRPLKGMIWQLLQEAEQCRQLCHSKTSRPVDLLLTLVTSGIVHILLFPDEDCSPVLQHIETLLGLLSNSTAENNTIPPYAEVQPILFMELEQMKVQNAQKQAVVEKEDRLAATETMDSELNIVDTEDDEWTAFLDPFRD